MGLQGSLHSKVEMVGTSIPFGLRAAAAGAAALAGGQQRGPAWSLTSLEISSPGRLKGRWNFPGIQEDLRRLWRNCTGTIKEL